MNEIRELRESLNAALRAKDADRVARHYAPETVMFTLEPPLQHRSDRGSPGKEGVEAWFATWDGPLGYETSEFEVTADGDVAFAHGLGHMSGTKMDGEEVDLWFRETLGLRRIEGAWKIVHQHESTPFLMDGSGKAALDLKPDSK